MTFHSNDILVKAIQDALGTDEEGINLISVARDAHKAEVELAAYLTGKKNLFMVMEEYEDNRYQHLFSTSKDALDYMTNVVRENEDDNRIGTVSVRTITINANE